MDGGPNKKRLPDRQITKDDRDDDDQAEAGANGGTFQRADDSVLATRRIVKARRPGSGAGAGAGASAGAGAGAGVGGAASLAPAPKAGLFSGFSLFQQQAPKSPAPAAVGDSEAGGGVEDRRDEADLDPRGRPVPPPPDPEEEEGPPRAAEAGVTEAPESDSDDVTSAPRKPGKAGPSEGEGKEEAKGGGGAEGEGKKDARGGGGVEGEGKGGEEDEEAGEEEDTGKEVEAKEVEVKEVGAKGQTHGFAKLSSAPNAFASAFGGTSAGSTFSFGVSPLAGAAAAPTPAVSPAPGPLAAPSAIGAFPSLSAVFGGANNSKVQLFGVPVADDAAPAGSSVPAVVTLPAVDVVTGEEEERPLFAADAVLFEFVDGGKWKERGKGEIRLNAPDNHARPPRLVMRARGNLRLLLNANLFPSMKVSKMNGRGLTFTCVNSAEESAQGVEGGASASMKTLALRFKEASLAAELLELMDARKAAKKSEQENGSSGGAAKDSAVPREPEVEGGADTGEGRNRTKEGDDKAEDNPDKGGDAGADKGDKE